MRRLRLLLLLLAPGALAAQVPGLSSRALGMAGAYTINARGFEAPSWNPAVLALSGRAGFSIGLPSAAFEFGSNAYGLSDLRHYAGKFLSFQDKTDLLAKVDTALAVRTIASGSPFGISIGRFALSVTASGDMDARLGKDAVELGLFGNAHRSGPGQFFTAAGSRAGGWGAATIAASYAMPFQLPLGRLSVGVTAKKVFGIGLGRGAETASQFQVNPAFTAHGAGHSIYTDYANGTTSAPGGGFGVDVGGILQLPGGLTVGATLVNVVATMSWDADRFRYERVDYQVVQSPSGQITDTQLDSTLVGSQIDSDPAARALRDSLLAHASFSRVVRAGATLRLGGILLAADGQLRLSQGLDRQPSQSLSVGGEYVLLGILPLRAGIGTDFGDGLVLSAGTGLYLGPVKLDVSVANISGSDHPGVRLGAGLALVF
jgi:hypothetical protein